jgi:hypothetical protein
VLGGLAIGVVVLFVYSWPGFLSPDSLQQYQEAYLHEYGDWHPPGMAALWSIVDRVIRGSEGMLILQSATFVTGAFLILRRVMSARTAALVTSLILVFPPVLTTMACIWKDSQMAGFLLLGIGLLVSGKRWQLVAGAVLMIFATAMRHNAAAATLPALVLLFRWHDPQVWWKRLAIASAVWALTVGATIGINKVLVKKHQHAWHISIAPADIIGTIRHSRDYSDAELRELLEGVPLTRTENLQAHMRTYYNPYLWFYYAVPGRAQQMAWPETEAQRQAIERAWKQVIRENPGAYLRHRLRVFRGVLGMTNGLPLVGPVFAEHADLLTDHPPREPPGIQGTLARAFIWLSVNTPLFRPYPVFFLAIVLLYFARRQPLALTLLVSGLLYELPLFFIAPSADNRYSHWMVTTTLIALAILIATRLAQRARPHMATA